MKKGFTLVELLAVIAVLAIILLIAIPQIISTINDTKKAAFKKDESMIDKAAINYLAANLSYIPANVGNTTTVLYSDLNIGGSISTIIDQNNGSECLKSKVIVTKQADGTLKYVPGIICDNYISIDSFDMLGGSGKFATDSNSDGLADGIANGNATSFSLSNGIQKFTAVSQWGCITKENLPFAIGDIFYGYAYVKSNSNQTGLQIGDGDGVPAGMQWHTGNNTFEFMSASYTANASLGGSANGIRVRSWLTSSWPEIEVKQMFMFNLTSIYGAGSEPTKAQMDALILKSM